MLDEADLRKYKQLVVADFNHRTNYDEGNFHPRLAHRLVELAELHSGQKILDVATGTGLVALGASQITGPKGQVIGVDISPGMLSQAQQKIEAAGLKNIELLEADADDLNFTDHSFDGILCSSAIVYLTNIPVTLQKWHHWLNQRGVVAFSCFAATAHKLAILFRARAQTYGIAIPNPNEPLGAPEKCYNLLRQAGFRNIGVKTEQFGDYLRNPESVWNANVNSAFGFQVFQLPPEKLAQCKAEYIAELEALATKQGIWNDIETFFVLARK